MEREREREREREVKREENSIERNSEYPTQNSDIANKERKTGKNKEEFKRLIYLTIYLKIAW